jgi:hypothetical protein
MGLTPEAMPSKVDLAAVCCCFFLADGIFFWFLSCCCFLLAAALDEAVVSDLAAALPLAPPEAAPELVLSVLIVKIYSMPSIANDVWNRFIVNTMVVSDSIRRIQIDTLDYLLIYVEIQ